MKICILGDVTTPDYYGGTANFNEGLAQAFHDMGHSVVILTLQKDMGESALVRKASIHEIRRILEQTEPELVIASMAYGRFLNKRKSSTVGLYYLHGFFNFDSYGAVRTLLFVCFQKWMTANADLTIANSSFTAALNRRMWGINSDGAAAPGVSRTYIDQILKAEERDKGREGTILFAGRLVKSKGIDRIVKAFQLLEGSGGDCGYTLKIAGSGPMETSLKKQIRKISGKIELFGRASQEEMYGLYRQAEVFVSLNETEPYGIVFAEALLAGCKIVCPDTGGQLEFLRNYPEHVALVKPYDLKDIYDGMRKMLSAESPVLDCRALADRFSYARTAEKIMYFVNGHKGK